MTILGLAIILVALGLLAGLCKAAGEVGDGRDS